MKKWIIVLFSWCLMAGSLAKDLEQFCHERGGELEKGYKCPKTSFPLLTDVCFFENSQKEIHFTDGCTGPSGGHNSLFLESCIKHDLCYHHEPASNGLKQKDCDKAFLNNLLMACEKAENIRKCNKWAQIMYKSLRVFGGLAYRCDDKKVSTYIN